MGDGIWKATHNDYAKTKQIIAGLRSLGRKVYGYIDVGVKGPYAQNLTDTQLKAAIDGWKAMGVTGVFGDEFGTENSVYRTRQNTFINYAHSKSLSVFANCWNVNDALGGTDCKLDKRDFYLLESYGYGHGQYRSVAETIEQRGQLAYYYMKQRQVGIITVATTTPKAISAKSNRTQPFLHSYFATIAWNFDGFGFTDMNYSAIGANKDRIFAYSYPIASYGTSFVHQDWIEKKSNTLYLRSTNTHHLYVTDKTGYVVLK